MITWVSIELIITLATYIAVSAIYIIRPTYVAHLLVMVVDNGGRQLPSQIC